MIKAVLLDISGVLYEGSELIPGAVEAVARLRKSGLTLRFVTNTSRKSRSRVLSDLQRMGFEVDKSELFTAPLAARRWLERERRRPFFLVHPDVEEDLEGLDQVNPDAVLLGDAGDGFTYFNLNEAFRLLIEGAPLVAVGDNRYFMADGQLHLDAGPFVRALEYAADTRAIIAGKPSADFYREVIDDASCKAGEALMVGDDVTADVEGALDAGLQACLVQTGKYRDGDEEGLAGRAKVQPSIVEVVEELLD